MYKQDYVVIGGDERLASAAIFLQKHGHGVFTFANDSAAKQSDICVCKNLHEAMSADKIIFGIPFSRDGETVYAPLSGERIGIDEVVSQTMPHHTVFGGKMSPYSLSMAKRGAKCHDYLLREDFSLFNADVTAEAIVSIVMNNLPVAVKGTTCLVMGYGRIGKALSDKLSSLGARVVVSARKSADFAAISLHGFGQMRTGDKIDNGNAYDFIVNTIPHKVLNAASFADLKKNCLVIDASSYPGFVDAAEAKQSGIEVMGAFSLPGKYAPVTSGKIIADVIENTENTEIKEK